MTETRLPEALNGHLHNKRLVKIGHPAIIWHRAYFKQQGLDDSEWHKKIAQVFESTTTEATSTIREWIEKDRPGASNPDHYIEEEVPDNIDKISPGESFHQKYKIKFVRGLVRLVIGFEVYEEFWSRKLIVDFTEFNGKRSQYPLDKLTGNEEMPVQDLGDLLSYLTWDMNAEYQQSLFEAQGFKLKPGPRIHLNTRTKPSDPGAQMSDLSLAISRNLHTIHGKIFREPDEAPTQSGVACVHDEALRFADFIGHSLGLRLDRLPSIPENRDLSNTPHFFSKTPDQDTIRKVEPQLKFKLRHLDNVLRATQRIVEDVNPIVANTSDWPNDAEATSNEREYCLTLINRRRALYVSSLGGAGSPVGGRAEGKKPKYTQPLGYMIVCPHQAEWQIGRIIDTLHNIGMYRLASMHEYERLAKVQNKLRVLQEEAAQSGHKENKVEGLEHRFTTALRDPNAPDDTSDASTTQACDSDPGTPDKNNEPSPAPKHTPLPLEPVTGGLRYRLDWSESYARTYWRLVESLHFERIEGYQHYREFIQRNLSDNFENIAILRRRIDYLDSFIAKRFYTFNQNKMADLQGELTTTQYEMRDASNKAQKFTVFVAILTGVAAVPVVAKILGLFNSVIVDYMKGASIVPFYLPDPSSELLQYIVSAILVLLGFRFLLYPQAKERSPNNPFSTPSSSQQLENEGTSQHAEAAQDVPQPA
ncbi:MAG: hypothetical protein AAFZ11_03100 [Pseudomonadota bacterium]